MPDCWLWGGAYNPRGYGQVSWRNDHSAHRFVWEYLRGPVPPGLELDHLCYNKGCVNPDHLEPVTHTENLRRRRPFVHRNRHSDITQCKHGHPFDEANTYVYKNRRQCRACRNVACYKHRERKLSCHPT